MATLTRRKNAQGIPTWWVLQWTDAQGPQRLTLGRIDSLDERHARDILRAKQLELSTGARILNLSQPGAPALRDYADNYLSWHAAEYPASTQRVRQIVDQHLIPRFGYTALDCIAPAEAEQYKQDRRANNAKAHTITKELRTLHALIHHAVRNKIIGTNPISMVRAPRILDAKPHLFYEPHDLARLYAACQQQVNGGHGPSP